MGSGSGPKSGFQWVPGQNPKSGFQWVAGSDQNFFLCRWKRNAVFNIGTIEHLLGSFQEMIVSRFCSDLNVGKAYRLIGKKTFSNEISKSHISFLTYKNWNYYVSLTEEYKLYNKSFWFLYDYQGQFACWFSWNSNSEFVNCSGQKNFSINGVVTKIRVKIRKMHCKDAWILLLFHRKFLKIHWNTFL